MIRRVRPIDVSEWPWDENQSLEGGANAPITERLSGTEVIPQQTVVAFLKLRPFDVGAQSSELLDLDAYTQRHTGRNIDSCID